MWFVWVMNNGKLSPQVWYYKPYKTIESGLGSVIQVTEVPEELRCMTIDELAERLPCTENTDE